MHLTFMAVAALAAAGFHAVGEPTAMPERCEIEVVFDAFMPALACNGCANSFTDSMEAGDSYTCPNGDRWTFTVGTPTLIDARCAPALFACIESGACSFSRETPVRFVCARGTRVSAFFVLGILLRYQSLG